MNPKQIATAGIVVFAFSLFFTLLPKSSPVLSVVNHIVISQIQLSGNSAADEFIELYNPSSQTQDLTGWKLKKQTASSTSSPANLVSSMSGSIPAHSYFLIAPPSANLPLTIDMPYTATTSSIAANNTVLLYDNSSNLIDTVGMGTTTHFETAPTSNPDNNESIIRKPDSEVGSGNGQDTDDNFADFIVSNPSNPRNSSSTPDPAITTPTPSPIIEPTATPTPEPTPTFTPEFTPTPSLQPTTTPEPSPTPTPSPTPESSPTPTIIPSPAPIQITPTPTPISRPFINTPFFTCAVTYQRVRILFTTFYFPRISCQARRQ